MRYLVYVLAGTVLNLVSAGAAWAASPATTARCQEYAEKTVHQFELLTTHSAKCHVKPDPQWQPNYDFHYNGCLVFPEFMARAGLMGRDAVLAQCGAFTDPPDSAATAASAPAATPQATAPTPAASTNPPVGTLQNSAPTQAPAASVASAAATSPQHKTADECTFRPPPAYNLSALRNNAMISAGRPTFSAGVLSYNDSATKQPASYKVQRPMYFRATMECMGAKVSDLSGTWVWLADDGQKAKIFIVSVISVQAWPLDPDVAKEIITDALPPARR